MGKRKKKQQPSLKNRFSFSLYGNSVMARAFYWSGVCPHLMQRSILTPHTKKSLFLNFSEIFLTQQFLFRSPFLFYSNMEDDGYEEQQQQEVCRSSHSE